MKFVKISETEPVAVFISDRLKSHLKQSQTVLWLVPGGSAIPIVARVSQLLTGQDVSNLYVTLTDERYGSVGQADSNWQQLLDAGFDLPGAQLLPVLSGKNRHQTTLGFSDRLDKWLHQADYRLGFFGIGPDGHTAGILPGSPAVHAKGYAVDYDANFERITMTFPAIAMLDEAVVYAAGEAKRPVLDQFETAKPLTEQPAQILKQIKELTVFNDYRGETV